MVTRKCGAQGTESGQVRTEQAARSASEESARRVQRALTPLPLRDAALAVGWVAVLLSLAAQSWIVTPMTFVPSLTLYRASAPKD